MDKNTLYKINRAVTEINQRQLDIQSGEYHKMALDDLNKNNIDDDLMAYCKSQCDFDLRKAAAMYVRKAAERYRKQYDPYDDEAPNDNHPGYHEPRDPYTIRSLERQRRLKEEENRREERARVRHQRLTEFHRNQNKRAQFRNHNDPSIDDPRQLDLAEDIASEHRKPAHRTKSGEEIVEKYLRPWIGALVLYIFGFFTFWDFGEDTRTTLSILTGIGGWFMFTAARGALVPSYYKRKGFDKKPDQYLLKMFVIAFVLTSFLLTLPSLAG